MQQYPSRCNRTHTAADAGAAERGTVCGRIAQFDSEELVLADETGTVRLQVDCSYGDAAAGDIVQISFENGRTCDIFMLAKATKDPWANRDFRRFDEEMKANLRQRAMLISRIRRFFSEEGFLEVETPVLVPSPGLEPHLRSFTTDYRSDGEDGAAVRLPQRVFLPTSPEYHMKRMLAVGFEKIFQLCKSFRNGESFELHNPEFTMLEWYRAYAHGEAIMADLERLGEQLALSISSQQTAEEGIPLEYGGHRIDFSTPWRIVTVREAFLQFAGFALPATQQHDAMRQAAREAEFGNINDDDSWEDVFYKVFLTAIEPRLGIEKPTFLTEYPASMAALAKRKEADPTVAERFELYIAGTEIANGFTELNDPNEQRQRFEEEHKLRHETGAAEHPIDDRLLEALEIGMPPAGGVAVGVDRLLMILMGKQKIEEVIAFPFGHDFPAGE